MDRRTVVWRLAAASAALSLPHALQAAAPENSEPTQMIATAPMPIYSPVTFAAVPGWQDDDQRQALVAFKRSCHPLMASALAAPAADAALLAACAAASGLSEDASTATVRDFFERHFVPNAVVAPTNPGLLTAYYEPILAGRRTPAPGFSVPLHRRPPGLVNLVDESDRASRPAALTHALKTASGAVVPFATREEIDRGALAGQDLELFYVADEVDRFFLQVQGSGIIDLGDGTRVRVTYDGKNGHPYTSVGRYLIDAGVMGADQMSLEALGAWLRADPDRGRRAIWQNKSYVFFREMTGGTGPIGVMGVELMPLRSLAIDPAFHALGLPIFLDAPDITHITGRPFRHLMVGQDVGSAIKGPERGDIYAGSGPDAGRIAGVTKQTGRFFVLLPKQPDAAKP